MKAVLVVVVVVVVVYSFTTRQSSIITVQTKYLCCAMHCTQNHYML